MLPINDSIFVACDTNKKAYTHVSSIYALFVSVKCIYDAVVL